MQKAKDSFFATISDRLSRVNSERTITVDGQPRPAVLVCENEAEGLDGNVSEAFCVRWGSAEPVSLARTAPWKLECVVRYSTSGGADLNGMNRGRVLAELDAELIAILQPRSASRQDFSGTEPLPTGTTMYWSVPSFSAPESSGNSLQRTATLTIFFHPEDCNE